MNIASVVKALQIVGIPAKYLDDNNFMVRDRLIYVKDGYVRTENSKWRYNSAYSFFKSFENEKLWFLPEEGERAKLLRIYFKIAKDDKNKSTC